MTLEALYERTKRARHLHETHQLAGSAHKIVYHIYGEIRDSVEKNKFFTLRATPTARVTLFTVKVYGDRIYVETHYRSGARRIWSEKCASNDEAEKMVCVIERAVALVGLKCEPKLGHKKEQEIFMTHE